MKKILALCVALATVSAFVGCIANRQATIEHQAAIIKAYENYYNRSQDFLEVLDLDCHWSDAYDPYDFYEAETALDSIYKRKQFAY